MVQLSTEHKNFISEIDSINSEKENLQTELTKAENIRVDLELCFRQKDAFINKELELLKFSI